MIRLFNQYKIQIILMTFTLIVLAFILGEPLKSYFFMLAALIAGYPIAFKAYQAMRYRVFSIELLVILAVIGALFIGEYMEAAVVTFLFLFGDFLEGRTLNKTR